MCNLYTCIHAFSVPLRSVNYNDDDDDNDYDDDQQNPAVLLWGLLVACCCWPFGDDRIIRIILTAFFCGGEGKLVWIWCWNTCIIFCRTRLTALQTNISPMQAPFIWLHYYSIMYNYSSANRTNTSWEGDPRKKDAMAWSCHENGWSTHSEVSAALGSCGIHEKTWQAKDELERCGKEGPPKNGIN